MKVRHVTNSFLAELLGVQAITLYPFILYAGDKKHIFTSTISHELIHIDQIQRDGVFKFYLSYLWQFFSNLLKFRNWDRAYREISYEKEAFEKQMNIDYYSKAMEVKGV